MSGTSSGQRIRAVITAIVPRGRHGPYAIAAVSDEEAQPGSITGSVTFGIGPDIWKGKREPEPGTVVLLGDLQQKRSGWRAYWARPVRPTDR